MHTSIRGVLYFSPGGIWIVIDFSCVCHMDLFCTPKAAEVVCFKWIAFYCVQTLKHYIRRWTLFPGVSLTFNTLRPRQNGRHFPDDILKWIFLNENVWIPIEMSLKFVPKGQINNIPALVQIMAWRRPGDKPFSEPMTVSLLSHTCVTRSQWINISNMDYACSCLLLTKNIIFI